MTAVLIVTDSTAPVDFLHRIDLVRAAGVDDLIADNDTTTGTTDTVPMSDRIIAESTLSLERERYLADLEWARALKEWSPKELAPRIRTPYRLARLAPTRSAGRPAIPLPIRQPGRAEARRHARKRYLQGLRA